MGKNIMAAENGTKAMGLAKKYGKMISKLADNGYSFAVEVISLYKNDDPLFIDAMYDIVGACGLWLDEVIFPNRIICLEDFRSDNGVYVVYSVATPVADESGYGEENMVIDNFENDKGPFTSLEEALSCPPQNAASVIVGISQHWEYDVLFIAQQFDSDAYWQRYDPENKDHKHLLYYGWAPMDDNKKEVCDEVF